MVDLPANLTSVLVVVSMGFYLAAISYLSIVPLIEALIERRRPTKLNIPALMENGGVAIAIAGFTVQDTGYAALGVVLTLSGALLGAKRNSNILHPALHMPLVVMGIICLGALGEYYYTTT